MRTLTVFSVAFMLMACLFVGCGGDDDDDDDDGLIGPDGEEAAYLGLSSMSVGSWAEYTESGGGTYKMEYHGTDTYDGRNCHVMEFEMESDGMTTISQIWIDEATDEGVLSVMKQGTMLIKMDVSEIPEAVEDVSDSEEDSSSEKVGTETYTTPTGKSVTATIYRDGTGEDWISGEVPFGLVKSIYNGEVTSELYDFGSSGATRDISKEEAENAESFEFPDLGDLDIPEFPGQ